MTACHRLSPFNLNFNDTMPAVDRVVYLPLEKLDKCSQCDVTSNLRLCASCSEVSTIPIFHFRIRSFEFDKFQRIYCSAGCQRADWQSHKVTCGMYGNSVAVTGSLIVHARKNRQD